MRLLEKSKSIYEYGSYVYYETGSPAFWRRHCQLSVSGKIPDVTCPVPAVGTCRNSCRTCHYPGRVVVPASGYRIRIMGFSYAFSAFMDCAIASSRGIGKSIAPTFIVIMGSCVFRIIWIYTVFAYFHTIPSLYLLYIFSWGLTAIAETIYFKVSFKKVLA